VRDVFVSFGDPRLSECFLLLPVAYRLLPFQDLDVFKLAHQLALRIYSVTKE
jgi:hypothetical protein